MTTGDLFATVHVLDNEDSWADRYLVTLFDADGSVFKRISTRYIDQEIEKFFGSKKDEVVAAAPIDDEIPF